MAMQFETGLIAAYDIPVGTENKRRTRHLVDNDTRRLVTRLDPAHAVQDSERALEMRIDAVLAHDAVAFTFRQTAHIIGPGGQEGLIPFGVERGCISLVDHTFGSGFLGIFQVSGPSTSF